MARGNEARGRFAWRRLWPFLKGGRGALLLGLCLGTLDAAAQASVPLFFRYVLNGVQQDAAGFVREDIGWTTVAGVALALVFLPVAYFFHVLTSIAVARLCRNLQVDLYAHVQRMSMDFFQRYRIGEVNARLNADLESLAASAGVVSTISWAPSLLVYSLAMMFWIDVKLAAFCALLLAGIALVSAILLPRLKRWHREVRDASGEVSATVTEYLGIHGLLKAYAREDHAARVVREKSAGLLQRRESVSRWQFGYTDAMQTFTRFAGPLLILILGAYWIHDGRLLAGDLAAFWGYWLQLSGVVQGLVFSFSGIMAALAALDRIFDFFDERPRIQDSVTPRRLAQPQGALRFDRVSFRYPGDAEREGPALEELSLEIRPGERVALVGPSGAGKSTLLGLLLRFYDPDAGSVSIDGVDLRELPQKELRSLFGVAMQDSLFFAGSIAENLRLAKPDCSEDELWQALEAANAAEFVRVLPDGLDSRVGEGGARLSGGQRQRLSIARVFLKSPLVVLLDEPTSALDAQSEKKVKEAMERLLRGRTSITVAHRLSTVIDSDRIVLMERGRVVAEGRHEALRASNALYADLCAKQGLAI